MARPDGPLLLLLRPLNSPLLFVLLGSGAVALFLGKVTDGAVVLGVVVLSAIIGFIQEYRAQKAIAALSQMVPETEMVGREGRVAHIPQRSHSETSWFCVIAHPTRFQASTRTREQG